MSEPNTLMLSITFFTLKNTFRYGRLVKGTI